MKKKGFRKIKSVLLSGAVWTLASMTVFAGDINANEQTVLDAAGGTFESGGKQYVATDAAKDRIRNYLSQDGVDLTAEQAAKAISQAFGNVDMGIAQGYLVLAPGQEEPVPPEELPDEKELPADPEEDPLKETDPQESDTETKEDPQDISSEDGQTGSSDGTESESGKEDSPKKMTKEEEDALISSVLEKEGLETEEAREEPEEGNEKASEKVDKLPGSVNVTAVAAVVVVAVLAVIGILLFRHKNRFKNK